MSTVAQKFENGLCRCCLSEGLFKSLSDIDCDELQQEIFAVTLKNCFSISLSPMFGQYSETTYGICDMCIYKLREANAFKNLVQESENKFQQLYSNHIFKELDPTPQLKDEPPLKRPKIEKNAEEVAMPLHVDMYDDNDQDQDNDDDDDDANNDDFDFNFDDSDDDDDKTLFDLRKSKSKTKKAPKKKAVKLQDVEKKPVDKPKKGKKSKPASEPKAKHADKDTPADKDKAAPDRPKVVKRGTGRVPRSKYYTYSVDPLTGDSIYTCSTCDKTTTSQDQMLRHKQTHLVRDRTMQTCRHCNQDIKVYALAYHIEEQHGIPAPTCEICGKKFPLQNRLEIHLKNVHLHQKPYICSICEAGFFHKYRLQRHMAAHTGERKYRCPICDKTFAWDANFLLHMKSHKLNEDDANI